MHEVPPVEAGATRRSAVFLCLGIAAAVLAAGLLYSFNPATHNFYPRCFLKVTTGLDCPGCGGLRATHQLLHGHIAEAFSLNPLFVIALPICALIALVKLAEKCTGRKWLRLFSMTTTIWFCAVVVILFGVMRNLPWHEWLGR